MDSSRAWVVVLVLGACSGAAPAPARRPVATAPDAGALAEAPASAVDAVPSLEPAEDDDTMMLRYRAGVLAHGQQRHADAIPLLERTIRDRPEHEVAGHAAPLLLDSLVALERHDDLAIWVRRLRDEAAYARIRASMGDTLDRILGQLGRREAELLERKQDYLGCARAYEALAFLHAPHDHIDEELYNAAVCFEQGAQLKDAIRTLETMLQRFPRSALRKIAEARLVNLRAR